MRRLLILALVIVGISLGVYFFGNSNSPEISTLEPVNTAQPDKAAQSIQKKVLKKALPTEVTNTQAFEKFVNPKLSTLFYLKDSGVSTKEAKEFLQKSYKGLIKCHKTGCGQGPDASGFYDPALTVASQSLKRILEISALEPDKLETQNWLEKEELLDLLGSPNNGLRRVALRNLFQVHSSEKLFDEILSHSENLKGYSAGDTIRALSHHVNDDNIQAFVDQIETLARTKDAFTITEVLENAEGIKLSLAQLEQIARQLCRFSADEHQQGNMKAMNYSMNLMASNQNFSLFKYCN